MAVLEFDKVGNRKYETGVERCVLFVQDKTGKYPKGVAWDGIIAISENPSGAEPNPQYADNIKYLELRGAEELGLTIEAYQSPEEFDQCDGSTVFAKGATIGQQTRKPFGLAWETKIGNDVDGDNHGYKLHLVYGCIASPTEKSHNTINESPEASTLSWEVTTTQLQVDGFKPTAKITIDSTKCESSALKKVLDEIYGTSEKSSNLPLPVEIKKLLGEPDPMG